MVILVLLNLLDKIFISSDDRYGGKYYTYFYDPYNYAHFLPLGYKESSL